MRLFYRRMSKPKIVGGFLLGILGLYAVYLALSSDHGKMSNRGVSKMGSYLQPMERIQNLPQRRVQSALEGDVTQYDEQKIFEEDFVQKVTSLSPAVILLTYMRSGSSMTGDILQRNPDVFYVFEPIWAIEKAELNAEDIVLLNGTTFKHGEYNKAEVYKTDLTGWLTCDFSKITLQSICSQFMRFGKKTEATYKCLKGDDDYKLLCVSDLLKQCKLSKTKIVKTLRISMQMASEVMEGIRGSKVIHLIRDPRATLQSKKLIISECRNRLFDSCSKDHCKSVKENTVVLNALPPLKRERVFTVLYEDILEDPIGKVKLLYKFVGMEFTDDIHRYTYNITIGGKVGECKVCSMKWQANRRPNSTSTSHIGHWKTALTFSEVQSIQNDCSDVISYYGYRMYNLED